MHGDRAARAHGETPRSATRNRSTWRWSMAMVAAIASVAFGSYVRVHTSLSLPRFDLENAEGMLKSDPALLYYLTQRVVESEGRVPPDFRADTRIEHPEARDLPAMFAVGQEFLIAWAFRLFGSDLPLHAFAFYFMAVIASLTALGVFALAAEVTGRAGPAVFAALLYATSWLNYRTASFIFMREDLSLPLYALHLWLLARAARRRTFTAYALTGLSLLAAVSTWHATSLVVLVEAACLFGWSVATGQNPLAARRAWIALAVVAIGSLLVPVLRAKLFALSPAMQIATSLLAANLLVRRFGSGSGARRAWLHLAALGGVALVALSLARAVSEGSGDYAHVYELLWAKLRFLNQRPADPALLSFGARIMWQGPFESGSLLPLVLDLPISLLLLALETPRAIRSLRRPEGDTRGTLIVILTAVWVVLSLLVRRNRVFLGITGPVVAALWLRRLRGAWVARIAASLVIGQLAWVSFDIRNFGSAWYEPPQQEALQGALTWIQSNLPREGAIASDIINSTALLAHTGHPIILQPKYETRATRDRMERFITALYQTPPEAFARFLREEFGCTYLLVDPPTLGDWRYLAGLRAEAAFPYGTAVAALLAPGVRAPTDVPGFELLYQTPAALRPLWLYRIAGAPAGGAGRNP